MSRQPDTQDDAALRECERATLQFMMYFDAQNYNEAAKLFAPDGVWHRLEAAVRGRDDFMRQMSTRSPGIFVRHVITNLLAQRIDTETVRVSSYVTVYRQDFTGEVVTPAALHSPVAMGRYTDVFRHIEGRWLLHEKSLIVDFKR